MRLLKTIAEIVGAVAMIGVELVGFLYLVIVALLIIGSFCMQ